MALSTYLRRALLYVPGSSQKMLTKSSICSVDSVIYDLEDSVTADCKEQARKLVANHIAGAAMQRSARKPSEVCVRVNAVDTGLALQDITQLVRTGGNNLDTVVIPKVQSAADLHFVADVIQHIAPERTLFTPAAMAVTEQPRNAPLLQPIHIIALIESAMGLANVIEICRAGQKIGLAGLAFAAEDFMASVGLSKLPDRREVLLARSTIVNACRAYNIPSIIDMVSVDVSQIINDTALEDESREGRSLGFTGKQAIHPSQIDIIQRAFGPTANEVQWATQVYVGDIEAQKQGKGSWKLNGRMIDVPVVKSAIALLDRARACGMNVDDQVAQIKLERGV